MVRDIILNNRSYRKFDQDYDISTETLFELVELARFSPSAMNRQPLRFFNINNRHLCDIVFENTIWAKHLGPEGRPKPGEQPSAYIVMLTDIEPDNNIYIDLGIALQSMLLGAVEMGLGGCIIGSVQRDKLKSALSIPDNYHILCVLALGKPTEEIELSEMGDDGNIQYWRDKKEVHHVPKRSLKELIVSF